MKLNYIKDNDHAIIEIKGSCGYDLSNMNLHRIWFHNLDSEKALFGNANFRSAEFVESSFIDCDFSGSKFIAVYAKKVVFENCVFNKTSFISSKFIDCKWINCIFKDLKIHNLNLIDCSPDSLD